MHRHSGRPTGTHCTRLAHGNDDRAASGRRTSRMMIYRSPCSTPRCLAVAVETEANAVSGRPYSASIPACLTSRSSTCIISIFSPWYAEAHPASPVDDTRHCGRARQAPRNRVDIACRSLQGHVASDSCGHGWAERARQQGDHPLSAYSERGNDGMSSWKAAWAEWHISIGSHPRRRHRGVHVTGAHCVETEMGGRS